MGGSIVRFLDSQHLLDATAILKSQIEIYNNVIKNIENKTNDLIDTWYGEGRTAFEKDYSTIYRQLEDISEVMYDLYDSLVDADATYVKTDEEIAKNFTMSE